MLDGFVGKAILTKARAMYGSRITSEEYAELLRKRTVGEIAAFLKGKPGYAGVLKSINEGTVHRGRLEAALNRGIFEKYERLYRYDPSSGRGFFGFAVSFSEVDEILRCLMFLQSGNPEGFIADIPVFLKKHASFDLMSLASVTSFGELLEVLEHTPYAAILKGQNILSGNASYTACETALKNYLYGAELSEIKKVYHGKTKKNLLELIKNSIELQNICTVFRAKIYYKKTEEEIKKMLCPVKNWLSEAAMQQLMECETSDSFFKAVSSSHYGRFFSPDGFVDIDNFVRRIKYLKDRQYIMFSTDAPVALYAFVDLCNIELFNITNIIEGVRYSVAAPDIQKLLIM